MLYETKIINLFEASSDDLALFKEKLRTTRGFLPVKVHPFFSELEGDSTIQHAFTTDQYKEDRDRFFTKALKNGYPFLIHQNSNHRDYLAHWLRKYGPGVAYMVPTYSSGPQPLPPSANEWRTVFLSISNKEEAIAQANQEWEMLFQILRQAGVNRVSMGGIYMCNYTTEVAWYMAYREYMSTIRRNREKYITLYPQAARWLSKDIMPTGCAGAAACRYVMGGFDVALSKISTPCAGLEYIPMQLVEDDEP